MEDLVDTSRISIARFLLHLDLSVRPARHRVDSHPPVGKRESRPPTNPGRALLGAIVGLSVRMTRVTAPLESNWAQGTSRDLDAVSLIVIARHGR
jgi:hypothetical protein